MPFQPFALERWQSTWEHRVRYNISESGVHPLSIRELLAMGGGSEAALLDLPMGYSQSNGTDELRGLIAGLYPGATADNVLVTVGSAEANFIACWALVEREDRVAIQVPTYLQTPGMTVNLGGTVAPIECTLERGWEPDLPGVRRAVAAGTKLVVVTNPNNPTGHVLSDAARAAILEAARAAGAWLLADEVYQGAERAGLPTPSFWGQYDRLIVVNGLSKAYGLPGLRIGWIVAPRATIDGLLERHDYTVIGPSPAMDYLAGCALRCRAKILERTRGILTRNYPVLDAWLRRFGDFFQWLPPDAGAICTVRFRHTATAGELVERIRARRDVLMAPGEHFGIPGHLRLGYGAERGYLEAALGEVEKELRGVLGD